MSLMLQVLLRHGGTGPPEKRARLPRQSSDRGKFIPQVSPPLRWLMD